MTESTPYWHEMTSEARDEIKTRKGYTFGELMREHKQPDWCTYPDALAGPMGCWSLFYTPERVNNGYCLNCECHRNHVHSDTCECGPKGRS